MGLARLDFQTELVHFLFGDLDLERGLARRRGSGFAALLFRRFPDFVDELVRRVLRQKLEPDIALDADGDVGVFPGFAEALDVGQCQEPFAVAWDVDLFGKLGKRQNR